MPERFVNLPRDQNQALGLGHYAIDFLSREGAAPAPEVLERLEQFHADSVACAVAAIATGTQAPRVLREEAVEYPAAQGQPAGYCFGSSVLVKPEKAVVANCAAVRELDANGTNFGYNPRTGQMRGEFGHNDFYPVVIAAARHAALDGRRAALAMLCLDEIRGRLAEAFPLRDYKIDHVVHGAIASAAVYGALSGASAEHIESAIGLLVAHYIPFRAIRAGHQLSDSKGASAALSSELAVLSVNRAMRGFVGPRDVFRNPQALFCLFEPPSQPDTSPFDLTLATHGTDFAIMHMHFKLGLYEHQSAGAIEGLMDLLETYPQLAQQPGDIERIRIAIYEPALSIIGDPAKRDPQTRQSADHSMVYIIGTLLRKAHELRASGWRALMLVPQDYDQRSLLDPLTRQMMAKIEFVHGGKDYDAKYPEGIPTTVEIQHRTLGTLNSGLVMYPLGHARNTSGGFEEVLNHKFRELAGLGVSNPDQLRERFRDIAAKSHSEMAELYNFPIESHVNHG